MEYVKMYIIAFIVFLVIDAIWLGLVAPKFYRAQIGHLMAESPNLIAALIFYLIFIVGVVYFVVAPGIEAQSLSRIIVSGLLFGFVTYATYDLTNLATLKEWPILVTVVDLAWGSFLSTTMGVLTYLIYNWLW
ncbi:DUF2177 family protein [Candidatus Xianfuyuplasma coldseepsis]|uniref:DUF2177 family protein n=1 Tax=Candidatus Xianfuyuplasma coldseepsis TaxID=2782163 RepID=A0A7L7KSB4_9MOLU|nr:DUF2177 family protein [Xianfuyuplasma coldseepsis]QMS85152.1 DUF2177 family protein [Xianfuyuplasma coldseepsis]